jgi:antitoxin (DNA-binding transcriptional repressor) of toxin-antitoxin stability system
MNGQQVVRAHTGKRADLRAEYIPRVRDPRHFKIDRSGRPIVRIVPHHEADRSNWRESGKLYPRGDLQAEILEAPRLPAIPDVASVGENGPLQHVG